MTQVTITDDGLEAQISRISEMPAAIQKAIVAAVYGEALRLQRTLQTDALNGGIVKRRTGRLVDSVHIESQVDGDQVVTTVGTDVEYAKYLEEGTAPHDIEAKDAPYLRFLIGSTWVRTKKVHHPGNPAFRPFAKTFEEALPDITARLTQVVKQALADTQAGAR